jgi:hypothetical protein
VDQQIKGGIVLYNIVVYVPKTHVEQVKEAMFRAGGGHFQKYDSYSWQVPGTGQFRPLAGSTPFIGTAGNVEQVPEYRVEMVCTRERIRGVLQAMIDAHPYEEVAYHACEAMTLEDF